jgi:hypothetical protein
LDDIRGMRGLRVLGRERERERERGREKATGR